MRGLQWLGSHVIAGNRVAVVAETIEILQSVFESYDHLRKVGIASTSFGRFRIPAYHSRAVPTALSAGAVAVFWGVPRLIEKAEQRFPDATILAVLWHPKYSEPLKARGFQELQPSERDGGLVL
jgi:hypothetical protein